MAAFALLPYRERALLPVPGGGEQGLLAQEITNKGTSSIVEEAISGATAGRAVDRIAGRAARRLIAGLARGDVAPGTIGLGGAAVGQGTLPGAAGTDGAGSGGGAGGGTDGVAALAGATGGSGLPASPVGASNPLTGPQAPAFLAGGGVSELLAAAVPEPATWMMFIVGFLALGRALRGPRRNGIRPARRS